MKVIFKNVGQGDSIIIQWRCHNKDEVGIIDCCEYPKGEVPTLKFLKDNNIKNIAFVIVTHLHFDHISGFHSLLDYCYENEIGISRFYHSINSHTIEIFDSITKRKRDENALMTFIDKLELFSNRSEELEVNNTTVDFEYDLFTIRFLSPSSSTLGRLQKQLKRTVIRKEINKTDLNRYSVSTLLTTKKGAILLTSDALKQNFRGMLARIDKPLLLAQCPHHGSFRNVFESFWVSINRIEFCPIVFSVGDCAKDKLPDKKTVEFFMSNSYAIYSTNNVYGIRECFDTSNPKGLDFNTLHFYDHVLDHFSTLRNRTVYSAEYSSLDGDKEFEFVCDAQ